MTAFHRRTLSAAFFAAALTMLAGAASAQQPNIERAPNIDGSTPSNFSVSPSKPGSAQPTAVLLLKSPDAETITEIARKKGYAPIIVEFAWAVPLSEVKPNSAVLAQVEVSVSAMQDAILASHFGSAKRPSEGRGFTRSLTRMTISPMFAIKANRTEIEAIAADSRVVRIHYDRPMHFLLNDSVPLIGMTDPVGAFAQGADGHGQAIAIIDSGVQKTHPFITVDKVILEACFSKTDPDLKLKSLCPNGKETDFSKGAAVNCSLNISSLCAHGTHVAGIAAGKNTKQIAGDPSSGVAKEAKLIAIQAAIQSDDPNICNPKPTPCAIAPFSTTLVIALEWLFKNIDKFPNGTKLAAINISLGDEIGKVKGSCNDHPAAAIIGKLRDANVATVIGSGNDGYVDSVGSPACVTKAIAVGGSTKQDKTTEQETIYVYSNMSSMVDVMAPGVAIKSSVPNNTFAVKSGTSMAAPHVAGAFAAIRSAIPDATVDEIELALKRNGPVIADTRKGGIQKTKRRIQVNQALNTVAPIRLQVLPTTDISASGSQGGPFSPLSFPYELKSSSGTISYKVSGVPTWLTATSLSGTATTSPKTITFKINANANSLKPNTYPATITFANTTNGRGTQARAATLTVKASPPLLSIAALDASKNEGNSGATPFTFTVSRTGNATGTNTVKWVVSASASPAASGNDFVGGSYPSGTVTFAPNATASKTITVNVQGDAAFESDENFIVTLSNPTAGAVLNSAKKNAKGTIRNDDAAPKAVLSIAALDADKSEGNSGATPFTFTIGRSGNTSGTNAVTWTVGAGVSPTASGDDFVGGAYPSGTVTFAPNVTASKTITVKIQGDTAFESAENFIVTLSNPTGGAVLNSSKATARGRIRNDDSPPLLASFQGLGVLSGYEQSYAAKVSADGSVVVGGSYSETTGLSQAFRWTASAGMVGLGFLAEGDSSRANGVSDNGLVVVGSGSSNIGDEAFRWTASGGMLSLDAGQPSAAWDTNADGSVVVGGAIVDGTFTLGAFRWMANTGIVGVGTLSADSYSIAQAVNINGSVVVGISGNQAFRWTADTGIVGLGVLTERDASAANDLNSDGSVVVGESYNSINPNGPNVVRGGRSMPIPGTGARAFLWTADTGMVELVPGSTSSSALGVNADGSVVVGYGDVGAFRWTAAGGMKAIKDLLTSEGVSAAAGWELSAATGISADGTTIVGRGLNQSGVPEAWIARLPLASSSQNALAKAASP